MIRALRLLLFHRCYSIETQAHAYTAFFEVVWPQTWFAGAHIWQMRTDFDPAEESYWLDFTPQGKPALEVLARGYSN